MPGSENSCNLSLAIDPVNWICPILAWRRGFCGATRTCFLRSIRLWKKKRFNWSCCKQLVNQKMCLVQVHSKYVISIVSPLTTQKISRFIPLRRHRERVRRDGGGWILGTRESGKGWNFELGPFPTMPWRLRRRANDLKTQPTEKIAFDPPNRLAKLSLKSLLRVSEKGTTFPKNTTALQSPRDPKPLSRFG